MTRLSVNVNKIATLRNARGGDNPDVLQAARVCIEAGCHGITVHPRPDERHIRRQDALDLAAMLAAEHPAVEFNVEGYPDERYIEIVRLTRPAQATLVPDPPGVLTSNAGWDLAGPGASVLAGVVPRLKDCGARVSLFLDPVESEVKMAKAAGADRIELYTEPYASAYGTPRQEEVFAVYRRAAEKAMEAGLGLNAGHDLSLENLAHFARNTPGLLEVSIGHALICDALYMGLKASVKAYLETLGGR